MIKVTIFGTGYVGLVTGVCLAELNLDVICVDIDEGKIKLLQSGESPIYEPKLTELLIKNINKGNLKFTTDKVAGITHGDYQFIAVGTPSKEDGSADLKYVFNVAKDIGKHLTKNDCVIINKSTVPIGTAQIVKNLISQELEHRDLKLEFNLASNPEFLKEGAAINDFMYPDRIIIGAENPKTFNKLRAIYQHFIAQGYTVLEMNIASAELSKYAANAFLATKISFINEISRIAEYVGADIEKVRIGMGKDPRIGEQFLFAGCGYGGSCFPKDVRALNSLAQEFGYDFKLLKATEQVNHSQRQILFEKISRYFSYRLADKTFAIWGLAFKANTDDLREASSLELITALLKHGAKVKSYDPIAMPQAQKLYHHPNLTFCTTQEQALIAADALVIVTEWEQFRSADLALIKAKLKSPLIFDGRNLFDPIKVAGHDLEYYAIGRGLSLPVE